MREQKPERMWAIATGINQRSGRRYLFAETVARTKRQAIERYDGGVSTTAEFSRDQKRYGVAAVRVLVTIEDAAPQGATQEGEGCTQTT